MARLTGGQVLELDGELGGLLGRHVEAERLDRDQPAFNRIVRAKYGTEAAGPDLMQDSKGTEGSGWGLVQGSVSVQRWCSSTETRRSQDRNTTPALTVTFAQCDSTAIRAATLRSTIRQRAPAGC